MIQHYLAEDGIQGYAEGDILIETGSGDTVAAVRDVEPHIERRQPQPDGAHVVRATGAAVAVGPGA